MESRKSHLDLFLTEISIELLGNKMYNINGKRQDKIMNLFRALPEPETQNKSKATENSNDFLCSLGFQTDFSKDEKCMKEFLNNQLNFILEDANKTNADNQNIISCLRGYKADQTALVTAVNDANIKKLVERGKLTTHLNRSRAKIVSQKRLNNDKTIAANEYYEREKNDLLKLSMDTLRLIKYMLNDPRNESKRGEMIGYVHAMSSVASKNSKDDDKNPLRAKPYRLQRNRNSVQ